MQPLRLIALDTEDLEVISAHLQDAVLRVGDMTYLPREMRFALVLNRFNWVQALEAGERSRHIAFERRRAGLHFDRVRAVRTQGINRAAADDALELLAIRFTETDPPAGEIELLFAGGATVRLDIECIEASLSDLGAAWETGRRPGHSAGGDAAADGE